MSGERREDVTEKIVIDHKSVKLIKLITKIDHKPINQPHRASTNTTTEFSAELR